MTLSTTTTHPGTSRNDSVTASHAPTNQTPKATRNTCLSTHLNSIREANQQSPRNPQEKVTPIHLQHHADHGQCPSLTPSLTKLGSTNFHEQATARTNYQKDLHHGIDNVIVHHPHHGTRTPTTSETFHVQGARHHHPPTATSIHRNGAVTLSPIATRSHARRERLRHTRHYNVHRTLRLTGSQRSRQTRRHARRERLRHARHHNVPRTQLLLTGSQTRS
jgi:hypothetical protein